MVGVQPSPRTLAGASVLVIDQDASSAKLVAVLLRAEGCQVRVAPDVDAAVELLQSFQPKLIVLELALPLAAGRLFADRVHGDPGCRGVPIIGVTALSEGESQQEVGRGCVSVVHKPLDPHAFTEFVLGVLGEGTVS